jgi:hypothetical protein
MKQELAETTAIRALGWLVGDEALLDVFLGQSGASPDDLRRGATDPAFLASVLDFILMDDAWVVDCAMAIGLQPAQIVEIRQGLPGGDLPNWT